MSGCTKCCDIIFKIFIFLIIIGPILGVTATLTAMSITVNVFVLLYFALIGWICEVKICDCHGVFLVEKLRCPWLILIAFAEKIINFFKNPLIKGNETPNYNNNSNSRVPVY